MNTNQHLVTMANQIGDFFAANGATGLTDAREHIQKFWAPSMRCQMQQLLTQPTANNLSPFMRQVFENMSL
ncbi:MAG: formate dehydrogenase subunit delta [Formosimonas sp.]